jgi:hypothetical protein
MEKNYKYVKRGREKGQFDHFYPECVLNKGLLAECCCCGSTAGGITLGDELFFAEVLGWPPPSWK